MALDPNTVGATSEPEVVRWTARDCAIYALGVGAGADELAFTTDNTRSAPARMLPTMPVVLGLGASALKLAGKIEWARLVHAAQGVELLSPLPVDGEATIVTRIAEMWDKGKSALITTETTGTAPDGIHLFRTRMTVYIAGAGGFGGERGPSSTAAHETSDRMPDHTVTYQTRPEQALIYRLSGDRNPLHSDPEYAARAGFEQPILHGLCTYGYAGRAILHTLAGGDPTRIRSLDGRFAKPVFPGDTLRVDLWSTEEGAEFQVWASGPHGERLVLDSGRARLSG